MGHIREDQHNQFTLDLVRQLFLQTFTAKSTNSRTYIAAGSRQFRTVWVRDFCWGLELWGSLSQKDHLDLPADIENALTNTIQLCLTSPLNESGFAPRGYDLINPKITVCLGLLGLPKANFFSQELRPEFFGEHGTVAFDSNLLICLLALNLRDANSNSVLAKIKHQIGWNNESLTQLCKKLLQAYEPFQNAEGCLVQPAFSDWQDSATRKTATSYINFLYLSVLKSLENEASLEMEKMFFKFFFHEQTQLFRSALDHPHRLSFESNLLVLRKKLFQCFINEDDFEKSMIRFYGSSPKPPVNIPYSKNDISWTTKICGLRHYHDGLIWPWQQHQMKRLLCKHGHLHDMIKQEFFFYEVLHPQKLSPFHSFIYKSEFPFFWSIASAIDL